MLMKSPKVAQVALETLTRTLSEAAETCRHRGWLSRVDASLQASEAALDSVEQLPSLGDWATLRCFAARIAEMGGPPREKVRRIEGRLAALDAPRIFKEVSRSSPRPVAYIDSLVNKTPEPEKVRTMVSVFLPGPRALGTTAEALREALDRDLSHGGLGHELRCLMHANGVRGSEALGFLGMMAEVRAGFRAGTQTQVLTAADRDMQRTNWLHTRIEVVKAARAFDQALDKPATSEGYREHGHKLLATLMGSLCSDAFKDATPHSLLWHNRAGAELVLPLLAGRYFALTDQGPGGGMKWVLRTAMRLAHEHQITPALFMSGAMAVQLALIQAPADISREITGKLKAPLEAPQEDCEIIFSNDAKRALEQLGVPGWATMDKESEHFELSQVVALADVMQYAAPDGLLKIAIDIRDPEQPMAFMRDPNIKAAVSSSIDFSFEKGIETILDEELKAWAVREATSMRNLLQSEIYPEVEQRLKLALGVGLEEPLPGVPYWNQDVPIYGNLSDIERSMVRLVKAIIRDVIAEVGKVPLEPFGTKEALKHG